jgi:high-affinity nickel-transport protein
VFSLAIGVAVAAQAVQRHLDTFQNVGGLIGATVSGTFLWIVGLFNLVVLIGIVKVYRELKKGLYRKDELEDLLLQRGFMNRLLGSRFRRFVSESWHMYPVGVLFGLGFDTASEVGLLAITATAATTSTAHHGAVHIPFLGIIALPILFTAGMSLMDTTDGVFMTKAYGWAFTSPLRKVYYNITTTALSVFVALGVGTIEYLQVASAKLNVQNGFFSWLNRLNFETLGYWIVGSFVLAWLASIAIFKLRRVEERWGGMVSD